MGKLKKFEKLIRVTLDEIADKFLNNPRLCACKNNLQIKKVWARRVPRELSQAVNLQHDNFRPPAHPHTANKTFETIRDLKPVLVEHPPYGQILVASDFQMFEPLQYAIREVHVSNDEHVKKAVVEHANQNTFFFKQYHKVG
jgi:hypothetical protein